MSEGFGAAPSTALFIIGVVSLLFISFLSAVEISISRLSKALVEDLIQEGKARAEVLDHLLDHRQRTDLALRGTLVVLQTVAVSSMTIAFVDVFNDWHQPWWLVTLTAIALISLIEFLTVSLLPVAVSRRYVTVALIGSKLANSLVRFSHIFDPFLRVKHKFSRKTVREPESRLAVVEDIQEIIDEVGETKNFDEEDKQLVKSVFEFGYTLVREVMVPRTSMVTVNAQTPLNECLETFLRSGFSRLPVIGGDVDEVIGVLYFKDVVRRKYETPEASVQAQQMVRPANFVPEMRLADDELRAMQQSNSHLALVVDEYGGIAGLVTVEDLLEELVGELTDEHDKFEMEPERLIDGRWRLPARFSLNDLEELLDVEIDIEEVDSVGGLLSWALGEVPCTGASAEVSGLKVTAEEIAGRRKQVSTVIVEIIEDEAAQNGESYGD